MSHLPEGKKNKFLIILYLKFVFVIAFLNLKNSVFENLPKIKGISFFSYLLVSKSLPLVPKKKFDYQFSRKLKVVLV